MSTIKLSINYIDSQDIYQSSLIICCFMVNIESIKNRNTFSYNHNTRVVVKIQHTIGILKFIELIPLNSVNIYMLP